MGNHSMEQFHDTLYANTVLWPFQFETGQKHQFSVVILVRQFDISWLMHQFI